MRKLKPVLIMIVAVLAAVAVSRLVTSKDRTFTPTDRELEVIQDVGEYDYYHQLTENQKRIYNAVLPGVAYGKTTVQVDNISVATIKEDMHIASEALENDHPEFFWFRQIRRASYYSAKAGVADAELTIMYYSYKTSMFDTQIKLQELNAAVKSLANLAREHSDDAYQQAVFVHDHIIKNAIYDHESLKEYYKTDHNPSCEYIYSAYGCLVNGRTVCAGYAKAFQLVMKELGVSCNYVCGQANGGRHAWNIINFEAEHYMIDLTWDDYDLSKEIPCYNYAFITDEMLERTHEPEQLFEQPACDDMEFQYYRYKGYYSEDYDFQTVSVILSRQMGNDAAYIQFGSLEACEQAKQALFGNKMLYKIPGFERFSGRYIFNKHHYTLMIYSK